MAVSPSPWEVSVLRRMSIAYVVASAPKKDGEMTSSASAKGAKRQIMMDDVEGIKAMFSRFNER